MPPVPFIYIDTDAGLVQAAHAWEREPVLGIDIECENNLHHYGAYVSIFQISTPKANWVVDALVIHNLKPLLTLFEMSAIQKIFHDVSFDLRIIRHQYHCDVKNIFDTQLAALFLGQGQVGLGQLLSMYFGIGKQDKCQVADWTRRPLSQEMLVYAVGDTHYLIPLRDRLAAQLSEKGRMVWFAEECTYLETKVWHYEQGSYFDIPGSAKLTPKQRGILKSLFSLRKYLAKRVDRPAHFIMNNKRLLEIAQRPPSSFEEWSSMRGVHPIVRSSARLLQQTVAKGKEESVPLPPMPPKVKYTASQHDLRDRLNAKRDVLALELDVQKHLLLSKDQIHDAVMRMDMHGMRTWQRALFSDIFKKKQ